MQFDNALAFYGTLRPGESNHRLVRDIPGKWVEGVIRGYVFEVTWSSYEGYPGFVPDPDGHRIPVSVLVSDEWDRHVAKVDEFEGAGYERRPITVFGVDGDGADGDEVIGEAAVYEFLTDRE
ncbi:MAG: gamma-glutamylcyclotransferase [Acidimicrobiia bacterium]|nr:gamma-glutamylcyclotransferase [Acidimicrobiia bacterium]